jgi:hypothetical protein
MHFLFCFSAQTFSAYRYYFFYVTSLVNYGLSLRHQSDNLPHNWWEFINRLSDHFFLKKYLYFLQLLIMSLLPIL